MLHIGASGCIHVVAVDMSGPAKISVEGRNCAEVLRSLSEETQHVHRHAKQFLASKHWLP